MYTSIYLSLVLNLKELFITEKYIIYINRYNVYLNFLVSSHTMNGTDYTIYKSIALTK